MITVVVPTLGRPSLGALLAALPRDLDILVVDDRPFPPDPLTVPDHVTVIPGPACGPAAARNAGWRATRAEWVVFLDDDVLPGPDWAGRLADDLADAKPDVGGVQGRLRVPLPGHRRPTDWERVTAGLADGSWLTADMAYRRAALEAVDGFDERLPRAFREDADLAYRVRAAGWRLTTGERTTLHPVRPESPWVSLRTQRGNADDALLRRIHGPDWRRRLEIPPGRRSRHAGITGLLAAALIAGAAAAVTRRRGWTVAAAAAATGWVAGTAEFATARIAPGPRDRREVATMVVTSVAIPPVAVAHWLRGWWRWRSAAPKAAAALTAAAPEAAAALTAAAPEAAAALTAAASNAAAAPEAAGRHVTAPEAAAAAPRPAAG
ncbi:transferase [Actinoplanes sp. SE50]|uniref:glycosyltransferase family 2 protein n=1 Tax=unclassified Actinoplanes TaxID=2626549 RepID=UPI00023EC252|nr:MULTISPECIES: glycosyltransferase [unclassified Actinoplanes]AEV83548.1 putative 55.3 kDa protein in thcA 5'region [Actinoplanes sp. SE50/110]ATO82308.1 transferase [Actinoplanes sp. SE50]SLL99715.1 transferase [Actinoplanes sp. SE50/110]